MDNKQFKAQLKILIFVAILEAICIGLFCYTYFVKGYFLVKNLAAAILGAIVLIMLIVKMIQGRKK